MPSNAWSALNDAAKVAEQITSAVRPGSVQFEA